MGLFRSNEEKIVDSLAKNVIAAIYLRRKSVADNSLGDIASLFNVPAHEVPLYLSFGIRRAMLIESLRHVDANTPKALADRYGINVFKVRESSKAISQAAGIDLIPYFSKFTALYGRAGAAARWIMKKAFSDANSQLQQVDALKPILLSSYTYIRGAMADSSHVSFPRFSRICSRSRPLKSIALNSTQKTFKISARQMGAAA